MMGLEQSRYQAQRSLKRRLGGKETRNPSIIAKGGDGNGTVAVSGRPAWAYIRLHGDDNQLTEAKVGIPVAIADLDDAWVRVRRASARKMSYYVIEEFISSGEGGDPTPPLQAHALDPDDGPHTGPLTEDDVTFAADGHDHSGGAAGKPIDHDDVENVTPGQHHDEFTPAQHDARDHSAVAPTMDVGELGDADGRLLSGAQKLDLTDGGITNLHQHAGGATAAVEVTLMNRTGGQRVSGDVVVTDANNDESFTGTEEVGYKGKILVVAETIADLTTGLCWERGGPFDVKVTGIVGRNDGLRTSATIYRAEAAPNLTGGGVFAIALTANISGDGTVKALFLDEVVGGSGAGGGTIEVQEDDVKVADADVMNFEGGGGKVTNEGGGKVTIDITPGGAGLGLQAETAEATAEWTTTSTSYTDLDSMEIEITTNGGKVLILGMLAAVKSSDGTWGLRVVRNGTTVGNAAYTRGAPGAVWWSYGIHVHALDAPEAGTYTYKLQVAIGGGGGTLYCRSRTLTVVELMTEE